MTGLRLFLASSLQTNRLLSTLAVGVLLVSGFLGAATPTTYAQAYSLIWSDEFNSVTSSNVDSTKWVFESGNNGGWGNNEREFYTGRTNNAYVAGGLLHIRALNESTNGFPFTSTRMLTGVTNGAPAGTPLKFSFTYGRVEWRANLPLGTGMWPALWMLGTNILFNNTPWPGCGEIDVVEDDGSPNFEQGSLHNGGTLADVTTVFTNFVGGGVANFHIYDFDWTTNSMVWSVDGVPYETRTQWTSSTGKPYPFPYNQPFFLLMNFALGGNYPGNPPDATVAASLPNEMQIDFVRVFQINPTTVPPSTVTGLTATLNGGSVVLTWYTANSAASYFVKRSLTSGGPYTTNANPTANGYTDNGATNPTTYYYVVSGVNNIGEGTNSSEVAVTIVPPPAPTGLTATSTGGSVSLNWNTASNAASYFVKRSLVSGGPYTTNGTTTATSFTDTNVTSCTTYYYVVSAVNNIGESTNSSEVSVTAVNSGYFAVGSGNTSPVGAFVADTDVSGGTIAAVSTATINTSNATNPAPQAVYQHERYGPMTYTFGGLTTGASYKVRLHWAEIYWNAAGQREFNVSINGTQVLTNFDIFAASGGMNIAIIREYTVTPVNNQIVIVYTNGAADQAKIDGTEIITLPPAAPTGLAAVGGTGQVALNWVPVPSVTGYNVKRSLSNGGPYTNVVSGITTTNYTNTGLASGTTYYYVVSAVAAGCNEGTNSTQASAMTAFTGPFAGWQTQYFGSPTNPLAAANVDADGTGQNNLFKYVAGLDPTNPSSVFMLTIASVTNQPTQMNLIFSPMVSSRTYKPQFNTDMVSGVWTQLTGYAGPVTNGSQGTITDMNAVLSNEFYRIDIGCNNCPYP
jgi:beta-glucanase (GH16 family)